MLSGEITIGEIELLTGTESYLGMLGSAGTKLAAQDINQFLQASGQHFTIRLETEDTMSTPEGALEKIQALHARGLDLTVGTGTTTQMANILGYLNSNKIVHINAVSNGPGVIGRGNSFLFRTTPTDVVNMRGHAVLLLAAGVTHVFIFQGNQPVLEDGTTLVTKNFHELGGTVEAVIKYDMAAKEFSGEVRRMNDLVTAAIQKYGKEHIAIDLMGFAEGALILKAAAEYPALMSILWISNDSNSQSTIYLEQAGEAAAKVLFACPGFGVTKSAKYTDLAARLEEMLGSYPGSGAITAYDDLWILVLAMIATQSSNPEMVQKAIPSVAANYFGASGWTSLNADGDRAYGDFDVWGVFKKDGKIYWEMIGVYVASSDTGTWWISPLLPP